MGMVQRREGLRGGGRLGVILQIGSVILAALAGPCAAAEVGLGRAAPISGVTLTPALQRFGSSVTFYHSFDQFPTADLSRGDGSPTDPAARGELRKGLHGQALLCSKTPIVFNCRGSLDLQKPGCLFAWIGPSDWKRRDETPYLFLINIVSQGAQLMLARMGQQANREAIYAYLQTGQGSFSIQAGDSLGWKDGEWHLLVVNWRPSSIEFSLDGGELQHKDTPWLASTHGDSGSLFVGNQAPPEQQYLIDDLTVLDRPLDIDEIKWIYGQK